MKNFNLTKRLWTDSHEKQSPQRFGRYVAMLLMLLTLGVGQMWAGASWIGNSFIVVGSTWYNASGTGQSAGAFNGANLGKISSLNLGGEIQTYGQSDGAGNPARMHYKFDDGSSTYITLYWFKYANNNNYFHSNSNGSTSSGNAFATKSISLSGLAAGSHKLKVWFEQPDGSQWDSNGGSNYVADFTLNPVVTFKANGGTGDDYTQSVTYNTNTTLTSNTFTKTGYNFAGWATSSDGSVVYANGATVKLTAHTTLYAKWTAKTTTVTLNGNAPGGETVTGGGTTVTATYDAALPSFTALTCTGGYNLLGYYTTASGEGTKVINANGTFAANSGIWNRTDGATLALHARWDLTISLTVAAGSNISSVSGSTSPVTLGSKYAISATPNTGYAFSGWTASPAANATFDNASSASTNVTVKNGSVTVTGAATEKMTTVTVNVSPTGTGTLTVGGAAFTPGNTTTAGVTTSRTVVASPINSDYTFGSWSVTGNATGTSSTNTYTLKGNGSAGTGTLTANLTLVPCSLQYGSSTPLNSPSSAVMSYDNETEAYYKDVTTNSSPYYFRFLRDSKQWSDTWDGDYPNVHTVSGDGTKVACATEVQGWENKASLKYTGANGSSIRIWFDFQNNKAWITETTYSVTVSAGAGGSVSPTSVSGVGATTASGDITATPSKGYVFTGWTLPSGTSAADGYTSASNPIRINATAASKTITANFAAATAFIEGRFHITNMWRNGTWTNTFSGGDWDESSTAIKFTWDGTNSRYYLHTYATPKELTTQISSQNPVFYIKESSSSSSLANVASYWSATSQTLTAAGTSNKKSLVSSGTFHNDYLRFNSSDESGYTIIYFDEAGIWYELEQSLIYDGNGGTGSAPAFSYYLKGTNATVAGKNELAKSYYTFAGWNTNQNITGTNYAEGASITMNANTTLYARWTRSVTLNQNGATTDGSTSVTATYNCGTLPSITEPIKIGYEFGGWNTANDGSGNVVITTDGELRPVTGWCSSGPLFTRTASSATLYAKWTQTVTLNANTANHGSGDNTSATIVYKATAKTSITHCTPATGYHLVGYYTAATDGVKVLNADGSFAGTSVTDYITDGKWTKAGATTLYAHYEPNTYDVTLKANTGSGSDQVVEATYDAAMPTTLKGGGAITVHTKTGYNLLGYWDATSDGNQYYSYNVGTSTLSSYRTWNKTSATNLYAHWTPKTTAITLDQTGAATTGSVTTRTGTYGAAMPAITGSGSLPTAPQGYAFMGYYDALEPLGTKYYNANGTSARTWNKEDAAVTLYAYFKKAEITDITFTGGAIVAPNTSKTVTATIEPTPTGTTTVCWRVLYSNGNPLSPQPTFTPATAQGNSVSFTAPAASGSYKLEAVLHTGSGCAGTDLSTYVAEFQVAGDHTVTVQYKDGSGLAIAASTSVTGRPLVWSDPITASSITGYTFNHWKAGDGITLSENGTSALGSDESTATTIYIKATYDGTLTAVYNKKKMVYFYNTVEWDTVFVYFYNNAAGNKYWADGFGTGANKEQSFSENKPFYQMNYSGMKRVAPGSNIWYCDYLSIPGLNESDISANIAFAAKNQAINKSGASNAEAYFYETEAIFRDDFNPSQLPMYVPLTSPTVNRNSGKTKYYEKGYWMNYPDNTGYTLKIFNKKANSDTPDAGNDPIQLKSIPFEFSADKKLPMSLTVDLEAGKTYGFKIYRNDVKWYGNGGTMKNGSSGDEGQVVWEATTGTSNCGLTTTSTGDYVFKLNYGLDNYSNYNFLIGVKYPEAVGDHRVLYTDNADWSSGTTHTLESWTITSRVIPAAAGAKDTVSFFVSKGSSPKYKIEKVTSISGAGVPTWSQEVAWTSCNDVDAAGVYNFILTQDGSKNMTLSKKELYNGNFYIRVDGAGSTSWEHYRADDHIMPFSEYSFSQTTDKYSHYYTHWYDCTSGSKNIKFVVANDYSPRLTDYITRDGVANAYVDVDGNLNRSANVRFMYNYKTNVATRRYIDGAQEDESQFLLLLPSNSSSIYDVEEGGSGKTQVKFSDKGNWIYEADVWAVPGTQYKLRSQFGDDPIIYQYFKGTSSTYETLIAGSGSRMHLRLLYDFKTNRLVSAWIPSGTISTDQEIHADIMFIREGQGDMSQVAFTNSASISEIENVYSVLRINKWTINNRETTGAHSLVGSPLSRYERDLYWISFPYDVKLSDVFGFGTYGTHWIIEYYDGAGRAANGFWKDSPTNWKFVTPSMRNSYTLKAGTGYLLALDLDELWCEADAQGSQAAVWDNIQSGDIIFPGNVTSISSTSVSYDVPEHECTINRGTPQGDRRIADSHWNVLGIPTYHNTTAASFTNETDGNGNSWATDGKPSYFYTWNPLDNTLTPTSAIGYEFKSMHSYMVQYFGRVTFTTSTSPAPASIVAHRTYEEAPNEVEFCIELQQNEEMLDRTFVRMSNDADVDAEFVFGEDMSKDLNKNKANIYTKVTTLMDDQPMVTEVAGNTLPMSEQTTVVPMGIMTPNAGTYTIAIPSGTSGVGVTLIDNETRIRTNLALMDYTVDLDAATYDDRFVLEISPMKRLTTDIEGVDDGQDENNIRKVLIDQQMYIIKDKTVFDARGARVK